MNNKFLFPAGRYYVGDPCYAVNNDKWHSLIDNTGCFGFYNRLEQPYDNWDEGLFIYNREKCFAGGTAYGDGVYFDNRGNKYGVDAGLIGIMPLVCCDGDSMEGGNILDFDKPFEVSCSDGVFIFGNIKINTANDEDDSEDDDDYFDDEDEEEDF